MTPGEAAKRLWAKRAKIFRSRERDGICKEGDNGIGIPNRRQIRRED
jgi:hypothetical protein